MGNLDVVLKKTNTYGILTYHRPDTAWKRHENTYKLEDLKVLGRSLGLFNNVNYGQGLVKLITKHICFTMYGGCSHFGQVI